MSTRSIPCTCTRLSVRHATSSTALVAAPSLAPYTGGTVASGGGSVVAGGEGPCEGGVSHTVGGVGGRVEGRKVAICVSTGAGGIRAAGSSGGAGGTTH